ncbi:TonB-dependent receptor [Chitinophaga parva]|uniref:TonB-dependent receptor n=1 Tax=Chitinophaga parva TaxID=2169414 RepID=A0A2T7BQ44_9BACT|nr:TonB-dependent receptor [Chitinophaga parva]PUZ29769.1 TonB-dependent receptor [Chitinophaga parva]
MLRKGLLLVCLLIYYLPTIAWTQVNGITYSVKNEPLEKVLNDLRKQSGYVFFYTYAALEKAGQVTLNVKDADLKDVLDLCFKNQPLTYTIKDKTVLIQLKENEPVSGHLQQHPVHGKVVDSTGAPLAGVSVTINASKTGTITNMDGEFDLEADANDILHFSYVGFESQFVSVGNNTNMFIHMQPHTAAINEVVVLGYGSARKSQVTSSVSTLKSKDVANKPIPNLSNSLIGRVSGVITTQASGEPGFDGAGIHIRGIATTGNNGPLVIVDGVPRSFSQLDPNTVQTMTILKDASAVAPYGVGGANGVILITTKQGATGAPQITYNGYVAAQAPTRLPKMVNAYQYAQMRNEANKNDGNPPAFSDDDIRKFQDGSDPDGHPDSQPLKEVIRDNSLLTYHNFTISGGSEKIKYFASGGYLYQGGMWATDYVKKFNASLNLQAKVTNTTEATVSVLGWEQNGYYPTYSADFMLGQAFRTPPTSAVYYTNGLWGSYIGQSLVGEIFHSGQQVNQNSTMQTQLSIEQKLPFIPGLSIKGVAAYDPTKNFVTIWKTGPIFYNVDTTKHPYTYNQGQQDNAQPTYNQTYNQNKAFTYQFYLNYHNTFGKHDITAVGVAESRKQLYNTFSAGRINYALDLPGLDYGSSDPADLSNGGYNTMATQLGYVYRVAYAYEGKYLLEADGRYDGNYYFAPGKKFGYFPAFSAGWVLSKEHFVTENLPWVDLLKLRGSWGQSGNLAGADFQYLSAYGLYGNAAALDKKATSGLYELTQANPNITWEKAQKSDIGLDASFLHNALGFEVDYFYEKRNNMLVRPATTVSNEYGISLPFVNAGIMSNHGVDLSVNVNHRFSKDLNLSVLGTLTYAHNKLLQTFETNATFNNPNRRRTGRQLGTQFGLKALGYFKPEDFDASGNLNAGIPAQSWGPVHPGDLRYADVGGPDGKPDGVIDSYDETKIGNPSTPALIYSVEPKVSFKQFDLDLLFQGAGISSTTMYSSIVWPFYASGSATELEYRDHWTLDHQDALYPRLTGTPSSNNTQGSSWWLRKTSYVRLRNLELGYALPSRLIDHLHIHGARFYVSGQNVWTWTPHIKETIDPESVNGQYTNYYQQRVWSFGANITF